jgi:putative transposase
VVADRRQHRQLVHPDPTREASDRVRVPNEQAAMKCLYLTIRSLDPTGRGRNRWKPALNAFVVTFEGRIDLNNN